MRPVRPKRIVVVGNGIAGLTAADELRAAGYDGDLTIVGDEQHPAYSRPALSKALLGGGDLGAHQLPPATHGAAELLGRRAEKLDSERRVVTLGGGETLSYDALVLATGSRARRLSEDPAELTLRGLDDALAVRERLASKPSVVVIGGGVLGMEIASACLAVGCRVTVASQGPPLALALGPFLSEVFVTAARERGLTVVETAGARIEHGRVVVDGGAVLEAELIVSAVGDLPNTEWLASSGLLRGGILTADHQGLVRPDIAAVGDLAAFPTRRGVRRIPLWNSAIEQSRVAAAALLRGSDAPTIAFEPYFWTEGFGLALKAVGFLPLDGPPEFLTGAEPTAALMRWQHQDGTGTVVAVNHRIPIPRLRRAAA